MSPPPWNTLSPPSQGSALLTVCSYRMLFEMITHLVFFVTHWAEGQRQIRFNLCVPGLWVTVSVH